MSRARLMNGNLTGLQPSYSRPVYVDAQHVVADVSQTGSGHEPDIARAENTESHGRDSPRP